MAERLRLERGGPVAILTIDAPPMAFAHRLANGPTLANVATKRVVRGYLDGGVRAADAEVCGVVSPLFDSEDLQHAVRTFLEQGPGNATFEGR